MAISDDVIAANSAIGTALASIEAQIGILETDHTTDKTTFNKVGGPQAAGALNFRMYALKLRCDALVCSTS